ncbi:hypothetical protein [Bradyrhizobium sp. 141]|nr:hypothetical protein [Bradyrhizobium sp. 141]MCK1717867.1 hypothetical protein [Bradyrhizobium sp. 141]
MTFDPFGDFEACGYTRRQILEVKPLANNIRKSNNCWQDMWNERVVSF